MRIRNFFWSFDRHGFPDDLFDIEIHVFYCLFEIQCCVSPLLLLMQYVSSKVHEANLSVSSRYVLLFFFELKMVGRLIPIEYCLFASLQCVSYFSKIFNFICINQYIVWRDFLPFVWTAHSIQLQIEIWISILHISIPAGLSSFLQYSRRNFSSYVRFLIGFCIMF